MAENSERLNFMICESCGRTRGKFKLGTCGHLFCSPCIQSSPTTCPIHRSKARFLSVEDPGVAKYFQEDAAILRSLVHAVNFQSELTESKIRSLTEEEKRLEAAIKYKSSNMLKLREQFRDTKNRIIAAKKRLSTRYFRRSHCRETDLTSRDHAMQDYRPSKRQRGHGTAAHYDPPPRRNDGGMMRGKFQSSPMSDSSSMNPPERRPPPGDRNNRAQRHRKVPRYNESPETPESVASPTPTRAPTAVRRKTHFEERRVLGEKSRHGGPRRSDFNDAEGRDRPAASFKNAPRKENGNDSRNPARRALPKTL